MIRQTTPYACHIFVCTNDRHGERQACADASSADLRERLKAGVEARGLKPRVRVSASGCMGLCAKGPNVMIHPQCVWFSEATPGDADSILDTVEQILKPADGE